MLGLAYPELEHAVKGGAVRQLHGLLLDRKHYYVNTNPWGRNIEASVGEAAVSEWRGRNWQPLHVDPRGVVDVGAVGQVRNTKRHGKPVLRVYATDRDDHAFMLVNVAIGKHVGREHFYDAVHPCVDVLGWAWGFEAKQQKYRVRYPDGGECWELPPQALRPVPEHAISQENHAQVPRH